MLAPVVQRHLSEISQVCQQEGIAFLAVFGSATRHDFTEASDIDLIVQFVPGQRVGLIRFLRIQDRLSKVLEGRGIDMHTLRELHPLIRDKVQQQMVPIFPLGISA